MELWSSCKSVILNSGNSRSGSQQALVIVVHGNIGKLWVVATTGRHTVGSFG